MRSTRACCAHCSSSARPSASRCCWRPAGADVRRGVRVPKLAEQAKAVRREQIIAAGLACFARTGYFATTMADVAAEAGVSKGTPYLYFDSKQALFLAL